jgi:hypothetical protein
MPWNGLGEFELDPDYSPEYNGEIIDAERYNGLHLDVADGITNAIAKDGQNVPVANLPMGNYKHLHCAPAVRGDEYVILSQLVERLNLTIPQVIKDENATLQLLDTGKHWYHSSAATGAHTWTIAADATIAYPIGHVTTFCNDHSTHNVILTGAVGVALALVGDGTEGPITIAPRGAATALKVAANRWMVQGKGATN